MTDNKTISAARWWQDFTSRNNDSFVPLIFDKHRFLVMMGGGGSGKSIFAGQKILERCMEPGHRFLVCRKVARTLRESCFRQLEMQAGEYYPGKFKINKSDMLMTAKSGSQIIFAGLDDVEKLKSIYEITDVWIEEASEISRDDFLQLNIRMRGKSPYYSQMIITFNPISLTHWLKAYFFDRDDPDVRTHHSTYKDNRFLPETQVKELEKFKETDEYYYTVYCLGQWGVTGKTIFDGRRVTERLSAAPDPVAVGYFDYDYDGLKLTNIRWHEDKSGFIRIYKRPESGRPYVIGGDTAGEGSDWFIGQVLDNLTGEQVCCLRHQMDEDVYARQMYCLGSYFGEALIGIEANYSTYPVKELERLGYRRQYVREREDTYTGALATAYGFKTTSITRPVIIGQLVQALREREQLVNDRTTLEEMLTFVRNEKLRPEAEIGAHDDTILALAIAHYIRPQGDTRVKTPAAATARWTADMWQDYRSLKTQAERDALIKAWGKPE